MINKFSLLHNHFQYSKIRENYSYFQSLILLNILLNIQHICQSVCQNKVAIDYKNLIHIDLNVVATNLKYGGGWGWKQVIIIKHLVALNPPPDAISIDKL